MLFGSLQCALDSISNVICHRDIDSTCLDEPTDRDQLIVKNTVSLLQTRVPGLESGKACTIRLPPLEESRSRMLLRCGTQRVCRDFLRVVDTVFY